MLVVTLLLGILSGIVVEALKNGTILVVMPSESYLRLEGGGMIRVGSYLDEVLQY